jgi:hypothetical protein
MPRNGARRTHIAIDLIVQSGLPRVSCAGATVSTGNRSTRFLSAMQRRTHQFGTTIVSGDKPAWYRSYIAM